jgi:hypothetical protein
MVGLHQNAEAGRDPWQVAVSILAGAGTEGDDVRLSRVPRGRVCISMGHGRERVSDLVHAGAQDGLVSGPLKIALLTEE